MNLRMNARASRALVALTVPAALALATSPTAFAASSVSPATVASCSSGNRTWVHIVFANQTVCYGNASTTYFSGNSADYLCSGNNYGSVSYNDGSGEQTTPFGPAQDIYFAGGTSVLKLVITHWSGSSTC